MDRDLKLALCGDEAFIETEKAMLEKAATVEKLLESSIGSSMLINFLNIKIEEAVVRGDFQVELIKEDFVNFTYTYEILAAASIAICTKQNYRARLRINNNLLISWKSPAVVSYELQEDEVEPKELNFHKPDELK